MFSQTTRLELIIAVAAVLLLWVCSRAPKSGNAETRREAVPTAQEMALPALPPDAATVASARVSPPSASVTGPDTTTSMVSDANAMAPMGPAQPRMRSIGVVDARNCDKLNYNNVLYGEVCTRPVWDGQKFVPRKVVVVRESNGVSSVWSFDEQDNVKLTEIQEPVVPTP